MALELITGRAGKAHVGSEDVRAYNAQTAGGGRYVLDGGEATIQSANEVKIAPAELLVDGAHVRITGTGEVVSIDNGASSYKRVDIIALHYKRTGGEDDAIETMELVAVKGTPADDSPADPEMPATGSILDDVAETYIPYARVLIDGLTPQTPTVLLSKYALPPEHGGTGLKASPSMLVNLASTSADTVLKASPRPGVTGTLPVAHGGTGRTSLVGSSGLLHDLHDNNLTSPEYFATFTANWADGGYTDKASVLKLIYPVGAVYISYNSTSPASLFGGTWTAITGRFPYFNAGTSTGGSNTHTLSVNEMPSHNHYMKTADLNSTGGGTYVPLYGGRSEFGGNYTTDVGGGQAHNNMPAYQTLYAWRRTA